jgi:arylsulfatase
MGYSDIGCYGGEVQTPNLNRLAENGLRLSRFYNTARCCPSRASLLTGLHPHQTGIGHMTADFGYEGYQGDLNSQCVTIAEVLKKSGYATYMSGKWHVTRHKEAQGPKHSWPCQRGFDQFYGIISGTSSYFDASTLTRNNERIETPEGEYYITDAISAEMCNFLNEHDENNSDEPFFAYLAYTAPHWPLHALPEDIKKYSGRFDQGWDILREKRYERMIELGLIDESWQLSKPDPNIKWEQAKKIHDWETRRMEVYAAQIDRMDQGIGRIIKTLEENNQFNNTLILFLSDNGACAEEITEIAAEKLVKGNITKPFTRDGKKVQIKNDPLVMPGSKETYQSYGRSWANLSNTPFREFKHWVHEGGIATPLIVHWPEKISYKGEIRHQMGQLPDIMATCLEVAGVEYPEVFNDNKIKPIEGNSLVPIFNDKSNEKEILYFEHEGNSAVRKSDWKLVTKYPNPWELYHMDEDGTEINDVAEMHPDRVQKLKNIYEKWANRCNVITWDEFTRFDTAEWTQKKIRDT